MSLNREQTAEAMVKSVKNLTDEELNHIITIPADYYPTNPHNRTAKDFTDELKYRTDAKKISYQEILNDVLHLSMLRHLISFGPRVFPEMDLLGIDEATEEMRKLEPIVRAKIKKYKAQT